jgi:predicted permease
MDWIASWRRLRRKPLYTLTIVLALSIGVGAVTVVCSWFDGLFLNPLPAVRDSRSLQVFKLMRAEYETTAFSSPDYTDLAEALATSMDVTGYSMARVALSGAGKPEQQWALFVSGNFFETLGLQPRSGRLLAQSDTSADPVAVIAYDWWQSRFHGDPAVIGSTLYLNRRPVRIAGVAPRDFAGPYTGLSFSLYVPLSLSDVIEGGQPRLASRQARWLTVLARLKPGVSPEQASDAVRIVTRRLDRARPKGAFDGAEIRLTPFWKSPAGAQAILGPVMLALAGVVLMVLLLACSNASGVMLMENSLRRREMAIRLSLGAGSAGLIRVCLAEAAILSTFASCAGVLVAWLAANHLQALAPSLPFPVKLSFHISGQVLAFAVAAAASAAVFCGMWSGLEARWQAATLKLRRERSRMRGVFIGGQIALSFVLLTSSAMFYRSVERSRAIDLGFDTHSIALDRIDLRGAGYTAEKGISVLRTALSRVLDTPGVETASLARSVPFGIGDQEQVAIVPDGDSEKHSVATNRVSPGYFSTLGIRLIAGRDFAESDRAGSAPVAIVNEALANKFWRFTSPLGRGFLLGGRRYQVAGVVRNTKIWSLTQESQPCLYLPLWQSDPGFAVIHVKSKAPVGAIHRIVEQELERLDPALPATPGQTLAGQVETSIFPQRMAIVVLGIFSMSGIYLAAMGLYGLIAHAAQSRAKEIAVRMAIGATAWNIGWMMTRQVATLVFAGVLAGSFLSAALTPLLGSILVGFDGIDVFSMAATACSIVVVAALASGLPALRAMRVQPAAALRGD